MPLTAKEFFCGAIGLSVGHGMANNIPFDHVMKILYKVAERYLIPKDEVEAIVKELDAEFKEDAKIKHE